MITLERFVLSIFNRSYIRNLRSKRLERVPYLILPPYNDVSVVKKSVFPSFPPKIIDTGRSSRFLLMTGLTAVPGNDDRSMKKH
jgi:hypothetical protein